MVPPKEELIALYHEQRRSIRDIAKKLGVPYPTVASWLRRSGVELRSRREATKMVSQKLTLAERERRAAIARNQYLMGNSPGLKQSPELILKRFESRKGYTHSAETRKKIGRKGRTLTPDQRQKRWAVLAEARKVKPTAIEQIFMQITEDFALPFTYVGDLTCFVGGRCPDFIQSEMEPRVIEIFSRWWHDPSSGNSLIRERSTEANVLSHFHEHGYLCLVIWEEELEYPNDVAQKARALCELPLKEQAATPWFAI